MSLANIKPADIVGRIQRLLLSPQTEWDAIEAETADVPRIFQTYVIPLAALAALSAFVFYLNFGLISHAITSLVMTFLSALAAVYLHALAINAMAPFFGAKPDFGQAFKVAAYAPTAALVSCVSLIVPILAIVVIVGSVYSLVLLYIGLPKLMKPAADKSTAYTFAAIGVLIMIGVVVNGVQMIFLA